MALSMKQIISKAGATRRNAAAYVDLLQTKVKKSKAGNPLVVCKTRSNATPQGKAKAKGSANTYVTTIEVLPSSKVIVSCSCDDFMYTWEAALNLKGAARIEYSNGELPNEKNPTNIPGCCKHLVALGQSLIDKGKL